MRILSWNINGLRAYEKKGNLEEMFKNYDIIMMQETKLSCPIFEIVNKYKKKLKDYPYQYWSPCSERNGYSGTLIYSKIEPKNVNYDLNKYSKLVEIEGRIITLEFNDFYLINVYTTNSGEGLKRLEYRINNWDKAFRKYVKNLMKNKKVIIGGDLNVAREEIDLKNPKSNLKTAGFTIEERNSFEKLLKIGLIDSFRLINGDKIKYSYWSYRFNSRQKNIGWRIDYFLVDKRWKDKILKADIKEEIMGSDHAPITIKLNI
jgi:exodeoxyribonuclease-3